MSERMNTGKEVRDVDHAFDPEARQAQADWESYLDSRDYQDANGSLHDAETGRFTSNPNNETDDEYYNRMQSDSETEGPFAGKGLKEIAEMVREAREAGDKTLEFDARAAFDDKFMETAEKYDWQGVVENADGTTTDRNDIADKKLAYYESIMDGTAGTEQDSEANTENSEANSEMPFTEADQEELNKKLADEDEEYVPKHRADNQDEDSPIFDEVAREQGVGGSEAKEGESQEEYEARQVGRHRAEPLPVDELDEIAGNAPDSGEPLPTDELDEIAGEESDEDQDEGETGPDGRARSWFNRAKSAVNGGLTKLYFGMGSAMNKLTANKRKEGETDDEYKERMKRNGRRVAVGIAAVAAAYGAYKLYHGIHGSGAGGNTHPGDVLPDGDAGTPGDTGADSGTGGTGGGHSEALGGVKFRDGTGGEALMHTMHMDTSTWYEHQDEFLKQFPDLAYQMPDGNVGLLDQDSATAVSKLPKAAQAFWEQYRQ